MMFRDVSCDLEQAAVVASGLCWASKGGYETTSLLSGDCCFQTTFGHHIADLCNLQIRVVLVRLTLLLEAIQKL